MPRCSRPNCNEPTTVELCPYHVRKLRSYRAAHGAYDRVRAAQAAAHIRVLQSRGWSWQLMMANTHLSFLRLKAVASGEVQVLRRHELQTILSLEATWRLTRVPVDATGSLRRMDGLAWQGWPRKSYAAQIGVGLSALWHMGQRGTTSAATAGRLAEFYREQSIKSGPCSLTQKQARGRNVLPPGVWDEHSIDDPDAVPDLSAMRREGDRPRRIDLDEVVERLSYGQNLADVAAALGFAEASVKEALKHRRRQEQREQGRGAA